MPMWLITVLTGCVLLLCHAIGAVGIGGMSVEKSEQPFLYGMGIALGWIVFLALAALTFVGK